MLAGHSERLRIPTGAATPLPCPAAVSGIGDANSNVRGRQENSRDGFEPFLINSVKSAQLGAVEVENAEEPLAVKQGNDDFGVRRGVASNVARKIMHVRHDQRLTGRRCSAADATVGTDPHARGLTLKWP